MEHCLVNCIQNVPIKYCNKGRVTLYERVELKNELKQFFIMINLFLLLFLIEGDVRSSKSSVVSSLDCLSSIVERISTEAPACPQLSAHEASDKSPCSPQDRLPVPSEQGPRAPSPGTGARAPDPVYQVL